MIKMKEFIINAEFKSGTKNISVHATNVGDALNSDLTIEGDELIAVNSVSEKNNNEKA